LDSNDLGRKLAEYRVKELANFGGREPMTLSDGIGGFGVSVPSYLKYLKDPYSNIDGLVKSQKSRHSCENSPPQADRTT